jgi:hypothetical protein
LALLKFEFLGSTQTAQPTLAKESALEAMPRLRIALRRSVLTSVT